MSVALLKLHATAVASKHFEFVTNAIVGVIQTVSVAVVEWLCVVVRPVVVRCVVEVACYGVVAKHFEFVTNAIAVGVVQVISSQS